MIFLIAFELGLTFIVYNTLGILATILFIWIFAILNILSLNTENISIRYISDEIAPIEQKDGSDWIDLRSAKTMEIKKGEWALIPLGVAMKLPSKYEAHLAPRSSTFKNYGLIVANSIGIIDESYCGNDDQWMLSVYATRDTVVNLNDRICQFRIIKKQPHIYFNKVNYLFNKNRDGFGSTGKQ